MTPTPSLPPEDADVAAVRHFVDHAPFKGPTSRAVETHEALTRLAARLESREKELWDTGKALANADRVVAELMTRIAEAERERDEERERFHRHVEEMIEPKIIARAEAAEAREAALAARLRALGYNVTAILESDLLATGPGATE